MVVSADITVLDKEKNSNNSRQCRYVEESYNSTEPMVLRRSDVMWVRCLIALVYVERVQISIRRRLQLNAKSVETLLKGWVFVEKCRSSFNAMNNSRMVASSKCISDLNELKT